MDHLTELTAAWMGEWLLLHALALLPVNHSARIGALRGLREQHRYERYAAYNRLLGVNPYPFDKWREVDATLHVKFASAH